MQKKLKAKILLLLIPPVVALLVFLGPLGSDAAIASEAASGASSKLKIPPTPDLWQVTSSLLGVLLIGAVVVMLIAKLRGATPMARSGGAGELLTLRQSLRISSRQQLHAVEFDGRVLLLGEHEDNITLLTSTDDPNAREDEHAISGRRDEADGVDLLDTPREPGTRRPQTLAAAPRRLMPARSPLGAEKTTERRADVAAANLADFKSLLRRARKKAGV